MFVTETETEAERQKDTAVTNPQFFLKQQFDICAYYGTYIDKEEN